MFYNELAANKRIITFCNPLWNTDELHRIFRWIFYERNSLLTTCEYFTPQRDWIPEMPINANIFFSPQTQCVLIIKAFIIVIYRICCSFIMSNSRFKKVRFRSKWIVVNLMLATFAVDPKVAEVIMDLRWYARCSESLRIGIHCAMHLGASAFVR